MSHMCDSACDCKPEDAQIMFVHLCRANLNMQLAWLLCLTLETLHGLPVDEDDVGSNAARLKIFGSLDALPRAWYPENDAASVSAHVLVLLHQIHDTPRDPACTPPLWLLPSCS